MQITNYEFVVSFDPNKLTLVTSQCNNGVCPGANALISNQVYLSGSNAVKIIGTGAPIGPNNDLQLLIVNFKTRTTLGATPVNLQTNSLLNTSGDNIGLNTRGATVNVSSGICGDANGDVTVNIIDALAVARKVAGLPPPPTIETTWADVDKNGTISIVDALHVARYAVGLVTPPEVCVIGTAL